MTDPLQAVLASIQNAAEFFGVELQDVNQRGVYGNTPLKVATVRGDVDEVRVLLGAGAEVNAVLEDGYTALHHAATQGHPEVALLLLQHGARTDLRNKFGRTPGDEALRRGNLEVARVLLGDTSR